MGCNYLNVGVDGFQFVIEVAGEHDLSKLGSSVSCHSIKMFSVIIKKGLHTVKYKREGFLYSFISDGYNFKPAIELLVSITDITQTYVSTLLKRTSIIYFLF